MSPRESSGNLPRAQRVETSLRIKLRYSEREKFVERFARNISRTGLFVQTLEPADVGSRIRFEYRLGDDSRLMRGVGLVRWVRWPHEDEDPEAPPGMGLEFLDLDPETELLVGEIVARFGEGSRAPRSRASVATADDGDAVDLAALVLGDVDLESAPVDPGDWEVEPLDLHALRAAPSWAAPSLVPPPESWPTALLFWMVSRRASARAFTLADRLGVELLASTDGLTVIGPSGPVSVESLWAEWVAPTLGGSHPVVASGALVRPNAPGRRQVGQPLQVAPEPPLGTIAVRVGVHWAEVVIPGSIGEREQLRFDLGHWEVIARLVESATLALNVEHGIDVRDDAELETALARDLRRLFAAPSDEPVEIGVAGATIEVTDDILAQWIRPHHQRLLEAVEQAAVTVTGRGHVPVQLSFGAGPVWPGLERAVARYFLTAPKLTPSSLSFQVLS